MEEDFLRDHPELRPFVLSDVQLTGTTIGEGSYGQVDEVAFHVGAAAKTIHAILPNELSKPAAEFVRECQLMSTVRHPNVVQFLGACHPPRLVGPKRSPELGDGSKDGVARIVRRAAATMTQGPGASVYMPPEASAPAKSNTGMSKYDASIDIFSLAVVTIFTICGTFPCDPLPPDFSSAERHSCPFLQPNNPLMMQHNTIVNVCRRSIL